ncbi:MAG: ABC transporter ATP-binding protein [Saprospiraceae bacterium]|nr:ABC transporter ATP-binding protein [Saprospiraceae bacterium]
MIELNKINKFYNSLAGKVHALRDTDLTIQQGEMIAIIGKSGSGKSTLLNVISGIDRPESGEVLVNGTSLNNLNESALAAWRGQNVGIVFQFYQLFPTLSAMDNVLFSMDLVNVIPKKERKARAMDLLAQVELSDKAKKFPNELSGGEKQRVAIARALANDPPIVVADEPTGNLDSTTGEHIHRLFQSLNEMGKTVIIVTHENLSERRFDRVIPIKDGSLMTENVMQ